VNIEGLEQLLLKLVVVAERGGGEVDEGFRVVDGFEKLGEFAGDAAAEAVFGVQEFAEGLAKAEVLCGGGAGCAGEGLDANAAEGLFAEDFDDLDAGETLEKEVGGAVFAFLTGAHDAEGGDAVGRLELAGFAGLAGVDSGDGEEPVGRERLFEHLLVTRFEDVQRQECLREKRHVGQRHDGDLGGQSDLHFHLKRVG